MPNPPDSETLRICYGGPLHRRVYEPADWDPMQHAGYVETDRRRPLGEIHAYGLKAAAAARVVRTWEWQGSDDARTSRRIPPGQVGVCLYRTCDAAATVRVWGDYDRAWPMCGTHAPAAAAAMKAGRSDGYYVHADPIQ